MKISITFFLALLSFFSLKAQRLDTIYADQISSKDSRFRNSILDYQFLMKKYKTINYQDVQGDSFNGTTSYHLYDINKSLQGNYFNKQWTAYDIYSIEISSYLSSSNQGINYFGTNLIDGDLKTAWVEGKPNLGIGEKFGFDFLRGKLKGGGSGDFYGLIDVFNGYCKNEKIWKANARVKLLKVYYNSKPFCYIKLADTWHLQTVNIERFFRWDRANRNPNAPFNLGSDFLLSFEIIEVYPGSLYKDVAISEFSLRALDTGEFRKSIRD